jgi:hypothetical protein
MTHSFTPVVHALVVATLLLATATVMLVTVNAARAANALAIGVCGASARDTISSTSRTRTTAWHLRGGDGPKRSRATSPRGALCESRGPRLGGALNREECVTCIFFCDVLLVLLRRLASSQRFGSRAVRPYLVTFRF